MSDLTTEMRVHTVDFAEWTYLCEKVEKFDHPVYWAEFSWASSWVNEDIHTDGTTANPR